MESRMQSADSNPMAFISNMRNQGGDMPGELKECGIDTQAIMQEAIMKVNFIRLTLHCKK